MQLLLDVRTASVFVVNIYFCDSRRSYNSRDAEVPRTLSLCPHYFACQVISRLLRLFASAVKACRELLQWILSNIFIV